jgi:RNA polymerase sigma factor (sigma-70 family)
LGVATSVLTEVIRRIGRLAGLRGDLAAPDEHLLSRFVSNCDEAAFSALVSRHGPMVLGVCRQLLNDANDVDDAFQATFLVLVRKMASIRQPELLGNWLYGVAYKVAARARANAAKRRTREERDIDMTAFTAADGGAEADLRLVIHEEVHRLPDKYRAPVLLCHIEGKSHEEAARQLCWPIGTIKGRLARAKELLRTRLARRGMTLSAAALGTVAIPTTTSAAVPAALLGSTVKAALLFAAGKVAAGGLISAQAAALTRGVLQAMFWTKIKITVSLMLAIFAIGGGAGAFAYRGLAKEPVETRKAEPAETRKDDRPQSAIKEEDKAKADKDAIQGAWRVVSVEKNGKEVNDDESNKIKDVHWTFTDGRIGFVTYSKPTEFTITSATYKLDPQKMPKEIDIVPVDLNGKALAPALPAIYSLDGDVLKICTPLDFDPARAERGGKSAERPTDLVTKEGSKTMLRTLRRDKGVSEYDYPGAKDKSENIVDTRLHLSRMLSTEDIDTVRKWYEKTLGIEHDPDLGHHGTQSHANGGVVSQVANDSTDQLNGKTIDRPVKVYLLTQDSRYHSLQIVLTRAEGEKQTHIVVTYVMKK